MAENLGGGSPEPVPPAPLPAEPVVVPHTFSDWMTLAGQVAVAIFGVLVAAGTFPSLSHGTAQALMVASPVVFGALAAVYAYARTKKTVAMIEAHAYGAKSIRLREFDRRRAA